MIGLQAQKSITATGNGNPRRYWIGPDSGYDSYNRSLANRIKDLSVPSILADWKALLEENNHGTKGNPFTTPNAFT